MSSRLPCRTLIFYCHLVQKVNTVAKADRLLKIITLLKGRRTMITARQLSEVLETSERTVYRDI
ncbi:HTH domain-containing protein [Colwelliaceae bacterium MEBiC 14330]